MRLFIQRVCARLCNLNNNGVIHPETICAAAECLFFALVAIGYTSAITYSHLQSVLITGHSFQRFTNYI